MSEYGLLTASALVSGLTNFFGLPRRREPRRLLVVKVDHLGDVITATPALRALRDAHPRATIDLLLSPDVAPLFEGTPLATRVLTYDSPRYRRAPVSANGLGLDKEDTPVRRPATTLRTIAASGYDTVVELRGDSATLLLPLYAWAGRRLDRGTVRMRDRIGRLFRRGRPPLHEVETNLAVVRPLLPRGAVATPSVEVLVSDEARAGMRRQLAEAGLDPDRPIVSIHPGAAWRPRAWRPARFAAIADWLAAHYDAQVVFVGSAAERDLESEIQPSAPGARVAWMFGRLSLPEAAALLQSSRLLIGNDSGLAHLAAACGTPTVALFGPQDPRRFRPWSARSVTLHHRVECFPCAQIQCMHPELPCVNLIEIAEVKTAVCELLGPPVRA